MSERIAEGAPAKLLPSMIATIGFNRNAKSHRRRVEDSYQAGQALLRGEKVPEPIKPEEFDTEGDSVGDTFSVAGDTRTTHNHYGEEKKKLSAGLPALVGTALGGTGIGAAAAMAWALMGEPKQPAAAPPTPAAASDADTQYEFTLGFPDAS